MEHLDLHRWDVLPSEAVRLQDALHSQVRIEAYQGWPRYVAGADVSFERFSDEIHAGFVVLELPSLRIIDRSEARLTTHFPYVPGLLSFREAPALLKAWENLKTRPDVVVLDGQGIAHPRRMGIASHFGLWVDLPTLGCAKSLLVGSYGELAPEAGRYEWLRHRGEIVGTAVRTKARVHPVYVSPGHRMDLESAIRVILACRGKYRIPEPTRQAHLWVNELRVKARPASAA